MGCFGPNVTYKQFSEGRTWDAKEVSADLRDYGPEWMRDEEATVNGRRGGGGLRVSLVYFDLT